MNRTRPTEQILAAERSKRLSSKRLATSIGGGSPSFVTAALLGQMRLDQAQAEKAAALLGLGPETAAYRRC